MFKPIRQWFNCLTTRPRSIPAGGLIEKTMTYGSVCSGIESATVAWHPLGWEAAWFSEIEPFPCKVLKHHYPHVANVGDMTKIYDKEPFINSAIDLLVGGTPCQSFSIAGLREGLDSANGNLALEYCRILVAKHPRWFVWENVPGVFSSFTDEAPSEGNFHGGLVRGDEYIRDITETSDFATLLTAFRECGYSVAYRVLDSQHFGVPQRRRRVFIVGHLGDDWRPSAAVLFERESMRRDFTPSREERQEVAGTLEARVRGGGFPGTDGAIANHIVACLDANYGRLQGASGQDLNHGHSHLIVMATGQGNAEVILGKCPTLTKNHESPILFDTTQITSPLNKSNPIPGAPCHTLSKGQHAPLLVNEGYTIHGTDGTSSIASPTQIHAALRSRTPGAIENSTTTVVVQNATYPVVRRLTPLECERLQGFPDEYTKVPGASDTARYASIGNSMTVNVMRWIGERIQMVDEIIKEL